MSTPTTDSGGRVDRQGRILEAALELLSRHGISGVNIRAVAKEAGVSLGLVNYHYEDKMSLIRAALHRIEEDDLALVEPDMSLAPVARLRKALRRIADPEFLTTEYLTLRLQLWSLAQANDEFRQINAAAWERYRDRLAELIGAARPGLSAGECKKRAADIIVLQNGLWLTTLLGLDKAAIRRSVARSEEIALAV